MNRVEGKVALVTGGAMGMGMTHSQLLAEEGAKVIVTDVNEVEGQKVADEINASGGTATFYPLDVTDESQWQAVVASVIGSEGKIDVLVNNAGLLILKPVDETTNEEWDLIFNINAKGPFLGTKG